MTIERVEIPDPWDMEARVREYYLSLNKKATKPRYPGAANINPSSLIRGAGAKCNLYLGYQAIGAYPWPRIQVWMRKRFASGTALHEERQRILKEIYGDDIEIEAPINIPELQMRGKIDGVLRLRLGWEFKPVSAGIFSTVLKGTPRQYDVDQTLFYFKGRDLESVTINYMSMDGRHDEHFVTIHFDEERYRYYERRIQDQVLEPIAAGRAPLKHTGSWCSECDFVRLCKQGRFD